MAKVRFFHYESRAKLNSDIESNSIVPSDIVFVNDSTEGTLIWTHGKYYTLSETEFKNFLDKYSSEDIIVGSYLPAESSEEIDGGDSINTALGKLDYNISVKADKFKSETFSETEITLEPNVYYTCTSPISSLNVLLSDNLSEGFMDEFMIEFTTASEFSEDDEISFPENVKWVESPLWLTNTTYVVAIRNNLGVIGKFN